MEYNKFDVWSFGIFIVLLFFWFGVYFGYDWNMFDVYNANLAFSLIGVWYFVWFLINCCIVVGLYEVDINVLVWIMFGMFDWRIAYSIWFGFSVFNFV